TIGLYSISWAQLIRSNSSGPNERPSRTSFLVDHLAVFMRRIGDAPDHVLCFLKSLRWHDNYVEGEAQTRKSATNPMRHFPKISTIVFEDEKVNVAVACHRAGRCRTKHNNEIGLRDLQNALHDLPRERIVQPRTCSISL